MNQRQILKAIIKQILLTEAPIDVWKSKNTDITDEQKTQAEQYFKDLTTKYNALLHPEAKDLTKLSFPQLEALYKSVEIAKSKNLKAPYIQWLTKQLRRLDLSFRQVLEDYIAPLLSLQKNKENFEPNFLDKLENIEQLNQQLNQKVSSEEMAGSEEKFGKLAEENGWVVYMPHTTEASCEIGKTGGRRDTVWCTTRPDESNLFLQYVNDPDQDTILFYVVKKGVNANEDPYAKMSVGFINGEPRFDLGSGNITVNADNEGFTKKKFEQVVGKDLANKFLGIMQEKAESLEGQHPAKEEFIRLVQNAKAFETKINSFADDENGQNLRQKFIRSALRFDMSPEAVTVLVHDKDLNVRRQAAENEKLPAAELEKLLNDPDAGIRHSAARNPSISPELVMTLVNKEDPAFMTGIANNPNAPSEVLDRLARKKVPASSAQYIHLAIAKNRNTLPETIAFIAKATKNQEVRMEIGKNQNTPLNILNVYSNHKDYMIRKSVALNPKLTLELFTKLAQDPDEDVQKSIVRNQETPPAILKTFTKSPNYSLKLYLLQNPNITKEIVQTLAKDKNSTVKSQAIMHLKNMMTEALIWNKLLSKLTKQIN
jgi:hypothetical protein